LINGQLSDQVDSLSQNSEANRILHKYVHCNAGTNRKPIWRIRRRMKAGM